MAMNDPGINLANIQHNIDHNDALQHAQHHPQANANVNANDANAAAAAGSTVTKRYRSTPAKTFQCTGFGDCRMVFSRSEHLARHIRKHTGERPFACHCSKQFSRLDNLRQHAQTVHADKPDQNEKMMKELTTLHSSMSAATGTSAKRPSKRNASRPTADINLAPTPQGSYQHALAPRAVPSQGYDQHPDVYAQQMAYQNLPSGQPMAYMGQDGGHYPHSYDPHSNYPNFPLSEAFPPGYHPPPPNQHHPGPPQLQVQPSYPTHPVYDYPRSGSDADSPIDNNPPPNSAHESLPSQSPATPTSANVPSSTTSLHPPHHPGAPYSHHNHHPQHHHQQQHHGQQQQPPYTHEANGLPYTSRSPIPTPPPQSFRAPLRGVRDGAAGGDYYQPHSLSSQQQQQQPQHAHAYQHLSQHAQAGSGVALDAHPKHEEYPFVSSGIKSEQPDGRNIPSRASTGSPPDRDTSIRDPGQPPPQRHLQPDDNGRDVRHHGRGGNDSAAGVSAGDFGGEQRFPSQQLFRGGYGALSQYDRNEYGSTRTQERATPPQHVPFTPVDENGRPISPTDRPGTAPASFPYNGQFYARPHASSTPTESSSSSTQPSRLPPGPNDKHYSTLGGFREHQLGHNDPSIHPGSNSPPFRFGAPSPRQQSGPELEQSYNQSPLSTFRRSSPGASLDTSSPAASRPGNLLRPIPGWSNVGTNASGFGTPSNNNDSPFSYNPPAIGYPTTDTKTRKRAHPGSDDDEPRPFSSRPGTRHGWDSEEPRPQSRRLSVLELCNTKSGGGGSGLPDGFDNRPRTSSGRFTSSGATTGGLTSSFSFPASASNSYVGNHNPNGIRPSSSHAAFQLAVPHSAPSFSGGPNPNATAPGGNSRPSSSAGRGLEQYALNLNGGSSRPGTASGQWASRGADEDGTTALSSSGIVLPPLNL